MPYQSIADLPKGQTDQYDRHQKEAFLKAFNNAYKEYAGALSRFGSQFRGRRTGSASSADNCRSVRVGTRPTFGSETPHCIGRAPPR